MPILASRVAMRSSKAATFERASVIGGGAQAPFPRRTPRRPGKARQPLCYTPRMSFQESLRALVVDSQAVLGFLLAGVIVVALTPVVARLAPWIGGVDDRDDRPRVHQ